MKKVLAALLVFICFSVHAQTIINLDTQIPIIANLQSVLLVNADIQVTVTTDTSINFAVHKITDAVRASSIATPYISFLRGFPVYGYRLTKSAAATVTQQVKVFAGSLYANVSANYRLEVIQYDPITDSYYALNADYDTTSSQLSFTPESIPGALYAEFYVVQIPIGAPLPMAHGRSMKVRGSGSIEEFVFGGTATRLGVQFTANGTFVFRAFFDHGSSSVATNSSSSATFVFGYAFFRYSIDTNVVGIAYNFTHKIYYDTAVVAVKHLREATLRVAKFSVDRVVYDLCSLNQTSVDTTNKLITYTSSNIIGAWAVFAEISGDVQTNYDKVFAIAAGTTNIDLYSSNTTLDADIVVSSEKSALVAMYARRFLNVTLPDSINFKLLGNQVVGFGFFRLDASINMNITFGIRVPPALALFSLLGYRIEALQLDTNLNQYFALNAAYDPYAGRLVVRPEIIQGQSLTLFYIGMVQVGLPLPGVFGRLANINAAASGYLGDFYNFGKQRLRIAAANSISVRVDDVGSSNPYPGSTPDVRYGVTLRYYRFTAIDIGQGISFNATLSFSYTAADLQVAGVLNTTGATLRYARYDTIAGAWKFLTSGFSVDITNQIVYQQTSQFSTWGVYGDNGGQNSTATPTPVPTPTSIAANLCGLAFAIICALLAVLYNLLL
jgi:hypothetical protein